MVEVNPAIGGNGLTAIQAEGLFIWRCAASPPQRRSFMGGGGERIRTDGLLRARQALSQLSYTPSRTDY